MDARRIVEFIDKNEIVFEEVNNGDSKLKALYLLEETLKDGSWSPYFLTFFTVLSDKASTILSVLAPTLQITIGYFIFSRDETNLETFCALGIAVTYYKLFHTGFVECIAEKVGITCSTEYGAKLYQGMINSFFLGLALQALYLLLVTIPFFMWSAKFLGFFITSASMIQKASDILHLCIPIAALQSFNITLRSFLNSQGVEGAFTPFLLGNLLLSMFVGQFFLQTLELGVPGWILFRVFYELVGLATGMYLLFTKADPNTLGTFDKNLFLQTIRANSLDILSFSACFALESLGIELSIFFVAASGNLEDIAAYVAFMNFLRIILGIGKGLSVILRTRVNLLIGKRSQSTAESFFWFFYTSTLIHSLFLGVLTLMFSRVLPWLYTTNEAIHEVLSSMIFLSGWVLPLFLTLDSASTVLRSLWKTSTLILIYVFVLIFFNAVLGWNLLKRFKLGAFGLSCACAFSIGMTNLCILFSLSTTDWSLVETKFKEYNKFSELIRRLTVLKQTGEGRAGSLGVGPKQGLRFSTNGVPVELLIVPSQELADIEEPTRVRSNTL